MANPRIARIIQQQAHKIGFKPGRFESEVYRFFVSLYPCYKCGQYQEVDSQGLNRNSPCHISVGNTGWGTKAHDICFPACHTHHLEDHGKEGGDREDRILKLEAALRIAGDFLRMQQLDFASFVTRARNPKAQERDIQALIKYAREIGREA